MDAQQLLVLASFVPRAVQVLASKFLPMGRLPFPLTNCRAVRGEGLALASCLRINAAVASSGGRASGSSSSDSGGRMADKEQAPVFSDRKWDEAVDLMLRRTMYGTLAGGLAAFLLLRECGCLAAWLPGLGCACPLRPTPCLPVHLPARLACRHARMHD